ncbi:hypothetical protein [Amycolatopsis kentuckyensis]|uniref:hypothetical protein n=1 Tax=Amycolatopsis kentuckyensis TaxID=218823 RepID=UPI003561EBB6
MRVSPFVFGVEVEQAATATAVLDAYPRWESRDAVDDLYAQYGRPGLDLVHEYENEPNIADNAVMPLYVVLH